MWYRPRNERVSAPPADPGGNGAPMAPVPAQPGFLPTQNGEPAVDSFRPRLPFSNPTAPSVLPPNMMPPNKPAQPFLPPTDVFPARPGQPMLPPTDVFPAKPGTPPSLPPTDVFPQRPGSMQPPMAQAGGMSPRQTLAQLLIRSRRGRV